MSDQQPPAIDPDAVVRMRHMQTMIVSLVEMMGRYSNARLEGAIAPLLARIEALENAPGPTDRLQ